MCGVGRDLWICFCWYHHHHDRNIWIYVFNKLTGLCSGSIPNVCSLPVGVLEPYAIQLHLYSNLPHLHALLLHKSILRMTKIAQYKCMNHHQPIPNQISHSRRLLCSTELVLSESSYRASDINHHVVLCNASNSSSHIQRPCALSPRRLRPIGKTCSASESPPFS